METNAMEMFNGIVKTEKACPECGHKLRLHSYVFTANCKEPTQKTYTDCTHCGYVSDWEPVIIDSIH